MNYIQLLSSASHEIGTTLVNFDIIFDLLSANFVLAILVFLGFVLASVTACYAKYYLFLRWNSITGDSFKIRHVDRF